VQPEYSIAEAYEILELSDGSSLEEAEAAYRFLSTQVHPDRFHTNSKMRSHAEAEQRKLNDAIQALRSYWRASESNRDDLPRSPNAASPKPPQPEPPSPPASSPPLADTTSPPLRRPTLNLWQGLSIAFFVVYIVARIGMFVQSKEKSDPPLAEPVGRSESRESKGEAVIGSQVCLSYEPAMVTLGGTITPKTFPGRPNFESVEKGDEPEKVWTLNVEVPLCTNKDNSNPNNQSETNISELQLVFMGREDYDRYRPMLGKTVNVTGTLYHSYTGHHHTTVMFQVKGMEPR
jgi:hypothetical protein